MMSYIQDGANAAVSAACPLSTFDIIGLLYMLQFLSIVHSHRTLFMFNMKWQQKHKYAQVKKIVIHTET